MPTEQSSSSKKSRRTTFIGYISRAMARNQHRYHRISTKVKWDRCYSSNYQPIYKDNLTKGNNDKYLIRKNSKNL